MDHFIEGLATDALADADESNTCSLQYLKISGICDYGRITADGMVYLAKSEPMMGGKFCW